jgi:hypothetical protein
MKHNYISIIKNFILVTLITFVVSCSKKDIVVPETVATQPELPVTIDTQGLKSSNGPLLYNDYVQEIKVEDYLSKPATGSKLIIPVIVIDWIPTENNVVLQSVKNNLKDYGDKVINDLNEDDIYNWMTNNNYKTKYSIEEGSKFRAYSNPTATPYVGIQVVKHYKVHKWDLVNSPLNGRKQPNYKQIFDMIGLKDLVEQSGVKEVWINYPYFVDGLIVEESNMSSPKILSEGSSADVSNSYHITTDLPIYDKTYVVYGNAADRWFAEMIHCRGHQIEAEMAKLNNSFFWNDFVGYKRDGSTYKQEGRAGSTHFTPNSTGDYDYNNPTLISSDIGDWKPDNSGVKKMVNNSTWGGERKNMPYPIVSIPKHQKWNQLMRQGVGGDPQSAWIIYWYQSIPSNSQITYTDLTTKTTKTIENWWDLFYNWDNTLRMNKNLYR